MTVSPEKQRRPGQAEVEGMEKTGALSYFYSNCLIESCSNGSVYKEIRSGFTALYFAPVEAS